MTNNSPCARHSPRLIVVEKFLSTPASSPRPILCGLYFHLFAFLIFMDRTSTGQIYCIRIKWWILLFNKSGYGQQFVQSHTRPFALLCCFPVNRAQAVQQKLGFSCWGRKRGLKEQINKASASRLWRLHWELAVVSSGAVYKNELNMFIPAVRCVLFLIKQQTSLPFKV